MTSVSRSAGTRTAADHRSNPSCAICTAREPARWRGSLNGVTPATLPLRETEAPDGTDVIDSVPTNVCRPSAIGAGARSGDCRCGVETLSSPVDGEGSGFCAVVDGGATAAVVAGARGLAVCATGLAVRSVDRRDTTFSGVLSRLEMIRAPIGTTPIVASSPHPRPSAATWYLDGVRLAAAREPRSPSLRAAKPRYARAEKRGGEGFAARQTDRPEVHETVGEQGSSGRF